MKHFTYTPFLLLTCLILNSSVSVAQKLESPRDSVASKSGNITISINYGSPATKGRKIWGGLVPYDKIWRTGANEATVISFDSDVIIDGKKLAAGRYALFAIPTSTQWTVIFNKEPDQWGAYNYNPKKDALRIKVTPMRSATTNERLKYVITDNGFSLLWEELELPVLVK